MPMTRVLGRVDKDGKVAIPSNVARVVSLKPGQLVEVKALNKYSIMISVRDNAR